MINQKQISKLKALLLTFSYLLANSIHFFLPVGVYLTFRRVTGKANEKIMLLEIKKRDKDYKGKATVAAEMRGMKDDPGKRN